MFKNKKVLFGAVALVLVTGIVSFTAGAGTAFIVYNNYPRYEIEFDANSVNIESVKKFNQVRSLLKDRYYENVDENVLLEGAVSGMSDSLNDPYTVYFNKDQMKSFFERSEGSYVGIGVSISMGEDGLLTVIEPFAESPALLAGIRKDDKIIAVDDKDVTAIRDENMIISMIKGPENTKVKVTVYRPSESKPMDFVVDRKTIKITNIRSEVLPGDIGYIKLIMFDSDIAVDFGEHLQSLLDKNVKSLIIDVRDNPGGAYDQVVKIADRILPEGLIVYTEDKAKNRIEQKSNKAQLDIPLAILINENSASASEILAGSVKDNKKGTLIGAQTFGKGLVQEVRNLEDGSGLKITVARYFTPSGVSIQGVGIEPDIKIDNPDKFSNVPVSQIPREEDGQLQKAVEFLQGR